MEKSVSDQIEARISAFCALCDFKHSDHAPCKVDYSQRRRIIRGSCDISNVRGVPIENVGWEYIKIASRNNLHYHAFKREDLDVFLAAIDKEIESGNIRHVYEERFPSSS